MHKNDDPATWPFAVLCDNIVRQEHRASVAGAGLYLPVCLNSRVPRNPVEKLSSGYKAVEYLVHVFGLCPALLYQLLPQKFYHHFCKLVFATRVIHRHRKLKMISWQLTKLSSSSSMNLKFYLISATLRVYIYTTMYPCINSHRPRALPSWLSH
jgi:hypothetical protein